MSGIGAIFMRDGAPVSQEALDRMAHALHMYGPERQSVLASGPVGFVYTHMGGFTGRDHLECQPMTAMDGGLLGVFSGRIDDRAGLIRALDLTEARARNLADGALFMAAWERWGEDAPDRLVGVWTAILWQREHHRLVAVRDQLSGPPLHYHERPDRLAIACAPKGLFALGDVPRTLDEQKIADSLILNYNEAERTYYQGIRRLPRAHTMSVTPDTLSVRRYYDLMNIPELRLPNDDAYVESARELFGQVVDTAFDAPVTPSLSLSSGLDSPGIAATAAERGIGGAGGIPCYTSIPEAGWDGGGISKNRIGDESPGVKALGAMYPALDLHFVRAEGLGLYHRLDAMYLACEASLRNAMNLHWIHEIFRLTRERGARTMVTGGAGNLTLSYNGMCLLPQLLRTGRWLRLARELGRLPAGRFFWLGPLFRHALGPYLPAPLWRAAARLSGSSGSVAGATGHSFIRPAYAKAMRVEERARDLGFGPLYRGFADSRAMRANLFSPQAHNEAPGIRQAFKALHGVEARDPMVDRRLVEWTLSVPDEQYLNTGRERWLIKRLMTNRLPDEILLAQRRGRQAADWHLRLTRDLPRIRRDVERMVADPAMRERLDVQHLTRLVESWPDRSPTDPRQYAMLGLTLPHAIATAGFIHWLEGRND